MEQAAYELPIEMQAREARCREIAARAGELDELIRRPDICAQSGSLRSSPLDINITEYSDHLTALATAADLCAGQVSEMRRVGRPAGKVFDTLIVDLAVVFAALGAAQLSVAVLSPAFSQSFGKSYLVGPDLRPLARS